MVNSKVEEYRKPEYKVDQIFVSRWSPRAMSGEELPKEKLMSLFEAAKWAPSAFNNQHWRFLFARRNTKDWDLFFNLMVDFNKMWTKNAAALVLVVSKKTFDHNNKPSPTHSFDTGAAWQNLALQGSMMGLVIHAMSGFDYEKAREVLEIPDDYNIEAMVAIGKPGKKEDLPDGIKEKEIPSGRKKLSKIIIEGKFKR